MYSFPEKSLYVVFIIEIVAFATDITKQKSYTNINAVQNKIIADILMIKKENKMVKV